MFRFKTIVFFWFVILGISQLSTAQDAKHHGDLVYRLLKHVSWKEIRQEENFVIGVVGSEEDFRSFQQLALKKKLKRDHPVEVRFFSEKERIKGCHLIYVSRCCEININRLIRNTKNEPVLIVCTEKRFSESGSVINFVEQEGKLKFEVDREQASKHGLEISDSLFDFAIVI